MATLTGQDIIDQGLDAGGDPSLGTRAFVALNAWLRRQYAKWLGHMPVVASGATSTSTIDLTVSGHDIERVEHVYLTDGTTRSELGIIFALGNPVLLNQGQQASDSTGTPTECTVRYGADQGGVTVELFPTPDKSYTIEAHCYVAPAPIGADDTPDYPSDETLIAFVKWFARDYNDHPRASEAYTELKRLEAEDRAVYGARKGFDERLRLDNREFINGKRYEPII